jgi:hypothetical protein
LGKIIKPPGNKAKALESPVAHISRNIGCMENASECMLKKRHLLVWE